MNRARLITYEQGGSEIHAGLHKKGRRSQIALKTVTPKITSDEGGQLWQRRQERQEGQDMKR